MLGMGKQQQALGTVDIPTPGSSVWPFKLGDSVKDKMSGMEGSLVNRFFHLSGCDRFAVEVLDKDGDFKHHHFAAERLELVKIRPEFHRDNELPTDYPIHLGDKIKDKLTGITGIASIWNVPLHGAMQIAIEPGFDTKKQQMIEPMFIDAHMVEIVTPYKKAPEPAPEKAVKKSPPGATRMPGSYR